MGQGWHRYYNFSNGWFISQVGFSPPTANYVLVPFYTDMNNDSKCDRYGYWTVINNDANSWQTTQWYLVLYGNNAAPKWDEVRVIPNSGYYQSPYITKPNNVRWGTASWTATIPSTASFTEQINMQVNAGSGLSNVSINGPIGATSNTLAFRANFTTTDADYSETPVLEDVTVTYLDKAILVYYR